MIDPDDRCAENPFHVLALPATATRAEVERAGQKWLAMLEVGVGAAKLYDTPVGPRVRTPELVRAAMSELRDPERRILHELWCAPEVAAVSIVDAEPELEPDDDAPAPFDVMEALRWR
jgi:hypothetical protein